MSALSRKLLRTIRTTLGQFLALTAIVMVGVSIYISMNTAFNNLSRSQKDFYEKQNFGDYYFIVVKAPETIINGISNLEGVAQAEGKVQKDLTLLKDNGERGTVRVTGYHLPLYQGINRLLILNGRPFDTKSRGNQIEAVVDKIFYTALRQNNETTLNVVAEGKKVSVDIVGTATSPEFMYAVQDANNWFPEPGKFGIVMIEYNQAQQLLNMQGQINQIVIKFNPGADQIRIKNEVETMLKPYGFLTSYAKKDQLSNAIVDSELNQLSTISSILPMIFFLVAAGIQFVILTRLIKTQRLQIGIMKALGYANPVIITYYTTYALLVSVVGTMCGILFGIAMAEGIADQYAMFFNLPRTLGGFNITSIINSFLITSAAGILSGFSASYRIIRINPADAMRPEPPRRVHRSLVEKWHWLWNRMDSILRMSIRSLSRNRARSMVTTLGIAASVMILLLAFFMNDCTNYMIERQYEKENLYNYIVHFSTPIKESDIAYWQRWGEISRMEPRLEIPAKFWRKGQENFPGAASEDDLIIGLPTGGILKAVLTKTDDRITIPPDGIIISDRLARKLGLSIGDKVKGETRLGMGPDHAFELVVLGVNTQYLGMSSFVSIPTANRLLQESGLTNAVMLKIDRAQSQPFEKRLEGMINVSSVLSKDSELVNLNKLMESMVYYIGIMLIFSMILGIAIVYNSLIMSFTERKRELASMMVLGFDKKEIGRMLLGDLAIQAVLGISIGLPGGRLFGELVLKAMESQLYVYPIVIYPQTYLVTTVLALIFVFGGYLVSMRRLSELDMVETLKDRE